MADRVLPGPVDSAACIREAVCVHTKKIFDSCREKEFIRKMLYFGAYRSAYNIFAHCGRMCGRAGLCR